MAAAQIAVRDAPERVRQWHVSCNVASQVCFARSAIMQLSAAEQDGSMASTSLATGHLRRCASLVVCVALAGAQACASELDASSAGLSLRNRLDPAPAEASEAIVAWNVTSGPSDYAYVWGRAPLQNGAFKLDMAGPPPAEALNSNGLGVGLILIVPRSSGILDGRQSEADEDKFESVVGASERHAIIYLDRAQAEAALSATAGATPEEAARAHDHWLFDFAQGYSCGVGKEAQPEEKFDSFVPVDCSTVVTRAGNGEFDFPDWT